MDPKKPNNDSQNTEHNTKDLAIRTHQKSLL
jgi:hypothetical protein